MKKINILLFAALTFLAFGCNEIKPEISPIIDNGECAVVNKSEVLTQGRQVIIEEFTGVRCVNCPGGSEAIEELLDIHGSKLIAVSIHAGFFSPPYPESQYDFRTSDGDNLLSFLGEPLGFPTAVVNRHQFPNESNLQVGRNSWASYIEQELAVPPRIKLAINQDFDVATRELTIEISVFPEGDFPEEDVRISAMITENGVADMQLTPDGKIADYEHKHIFRDMITNFDGNPLTPEQLATTEGFCKSYVTTLDEAWDVNKCKVIAFAHLGGASKQVLQAAEVSLN
ncbi:MAG: Omp28-related outer membrane protein [Bacteroidota bacterium]